MRTPGTLRRAAWAGFVSAALPFFGALAAAAPPPVGAGRPAPPPADTAAPLLPLPWLTELLKREGFSVHGSTKNYWIACASPTVRIEKDMLVLSGYGFMPNGDFVELETKEPVALKLIGGILRGLVPFARAAKADALSAGMNLQSWGLPVAFDGLHLLNPDGSVTYYGRMLHDALAGQDKKAARQALSGERLGKALELFEEAYTQAFSAACPDIAHVQLQRAWDMLSWEKPVAGETPLALARYDMLTDNLTYRDALNKALLGASASSPAEKAELKMASAAVELLRKHRYHEDKALDIKSKLLSFFAPPSGPTPRVSWLPGLLKVLERVNGKPLSVSQSRALVESFPMGETIWRMGAQELWKAGFTGAGVKVAVIDTGVGAHAALDDSVKERRHFGRQRGGAKNGSHATHVAGVIHALAPDAQIGSFQVLDGNPRANPELRLGDSETEEALGQAIDEAVKAGYSVVSLSLGMRGHPGEALARKIEAHAKNGVLFVVAAGNSGEEGVRAPSNAYAALSVGALNANGRMTNYSSYGEVFDPAKLAYSIKTVLMAPGHNILSCVLPLVVNGESDEYGRMSGTSMATPHVSGAVALLLEAVKALNPGIDPVQASLKVREALASSAKPIPRNQLPPEVAPDQLFLVVDPKAAYETLRPKS